MLFESSRRFFFASLPDQHRPGNLGERSRSHKKKHLSSLAATCCSAQARQPLVAAKGPQSAGTC